MNTISFILLIVMQILLYSSSLFEKQQVWTANRPSIAIDTTFELGLNYY